MESDPEQGAATSQVDRPSLEAIADDPVELEEILTHVPETHAPIARVEIEENSAVTVAPASLTDQEALDKEERINQIHCPQCESSNLRTNGHYKGKQKYACKDCGKKFVPSDSVDQGVDRETKTNSDVSTPEVKASQLDSNVPAKQDKDSKGNRRKKAKGFGRS